MWVLENKLRSLCLYGGHFSDCSLSSPLLLLLRVLLPWMQWAEVPSRHLPLVFPSILVWVWNQLGPPLLTPVLTAERRPAEGAAEAGV